MIFKKINQLFNKKITKFLYLLHGYKRFSGRNHTGVITVRHKGGGRKNKLRLVDFRGFDIQSKGQIIGWDRVNNLTSWVSLVKYPSGCYKYILGCNQLDVNSTIQTILKSSIKFSTPGIRTFIKNIKIGTMVYNVEKYPFQGGVFIRSAGVFGKVISVNNKLFILLPSKKKIKLSGYCLATIGRVSNVYHQLIKFRNAGQRRLQGIRPTVLGVAMNAVDHPHGGSTRGGKKIKTPWGKIMKK